MSEEKKTRWEFLGKIGVCVYFLRATNFTNPLLTPEILAQLESARSEVAKLEKLLRERFKK